MSSIELFRSKARAPRWERLAERYIEALGHFSVFIGASPRRSPVKFGYNAELQDRTRGKVFVVWERQWLNSEKSARSVLEFIAKRHAALRTGQPIYGWFDTNVDEARRILADAIAAVGVHPTPNAIVVGRAEEFAKRVDDEAIAMQRRGEMKPVNQAYRTQRLEALAAGKKMPGYEEWRDAYLHNVIEKIAEETIAPIFSSG